MQIQMVNITYYKIKSLDDLKYLLTDRLSYWNGWWQIDENDTIININTGELIGSYQPWYYGEPNGRLLENCMVSWPQRNAWNDVNCIKKFYAFCEFDGYPNLSLRGEGKVLNFTFVKINFTFVKIYFSPPKAYVQNQDLMTDSVGMKNLKTGDMLLEAS